MAAINSGDLGFKMKHPVILIFYLVQCGMMERLRKISEIFASVDNCNTSVDVLYAGTSFKMISVQNIYLNSQRNAQWTLLKFYR